MQNLCDYKLNANNITRMCGALERRGKRVVQSLLVI